MRNDRKDEITMETKAKEITLFASVKAVLTTAILGIALIELQTIFNLDGIRTIATLSLITCICILAISLYLFELTKKGLLKTTGQIIQLYGLDWLDNTKILLSNWLQSIVITIAILLNLLGFVFAPLIILVAVIGGLSFVVLSRNECKTKKDVIKYFIYGYLFGIGSTICGLLITYLISLFGVFWIGGLIITDAVFTGFYTYLDLLEWEHETEMQKKPEVVEPQQ